MRHIIALSGGESSAAVAVILRDLDPILYFNDTKWEHPDLYRYIRELSDYLGIPITEDTDGRTPEDIAYTEGPFLPNNRKPLCSAILKAKRLQKFAMPGDRLYFGIGSHEIHRAARIRTIYTGLGINTYFPLVERGLDSTDARNIMAATGIPAPALYAMGFEHNNCSGGCVRQGAKQWRHLLRVAPDVYAERERLEREFNERIKPKTYVTFLKDMSLKRLREIEESHLELNFGPEEWQGECIGMCGTMA